MGKRKITQNSKEASYVLRMARMLYAIEYLGRYCNVCGYDGFESPWNMDFHHRNHSQKLYEVKNLLYHGNFENHRSEIEKCDLLCSKCHRAEHASKDKYMKFKDKIINQLNNIKSHGLHLISPPLDQSKKNEFITLVNDGYTMKEISNITNVNYDRVKYHIRCLKLKAERGGKIKLPETIIVKLLNQRHSIRSIAVKLGINRETIRSWIVNHVELTEQNKVKIYKKIHL